MKKYYFLVLALIFSLKIFSQTSHGVPIAEYNALVDLYNYTNGANWISEQTNTADNWLTAAPVDDWYGITVVNGHISEVSLSNNNLVGTIPESIGGLSYSGPAINLSNNQLSGSLPVGLGTYWNTLDISFNQFDNIPDNFFCHPYTNDIRFQNNRFTFEDLSHIDYAYFPLEDGFITYYPQANIGVTETKVLYLGDSYTINLGIDAGITGNVYSWYKNGALIATTATNSYTITINSASNAGVYTCEVWNPDFRYLTLNSNPVTINVHSSGVPQSEYNALLDLYNSTNGPGWTSEQTNPADNWLTVAPVDDWYGITVVNGHISEVNLSNNNLIGIIPESIGGLSYSAPAINLSNNQLSGSLPLGLGTYWNTLDLSFNQFDNIPDNFFCHPNTHDIRFQNNRFTFEDLSHIDYAYFPLEDGFITYYPQSIIGQTETKSLSCGESYTINLGIDAGITGNVYSWYKNGALIATTATNSYTITINSASNAGVYTCEAWNPDFRYLTLYSNPVTISINYLVGTPDAISVSGPDFIYHNAPNTQISVPLINNATTYNWSISPSSAGIIVGSGNSVAIDWNDNFVSGDIPILITVYGSNSNYPDCTGPLSDPLNLNYYSGVDYSQVSALWDLYQSTNGPGWFGEQTNPADNWSLNTLVFDWYGITVVNGHISEVNLSNNNLIGIIPESIGGLSYSAPAINLSNNQLSGYLPVGLGTYWNTLDLSFNQFDNIPDNFFCHPNTHDIRFQNNRFTFEDLSHIDYAYFPLEDGFITYYPQSIIGQTETKSLSCGESYTINLGIDAGITGNVYSWYKNGALIATTTTNSYTITINSASNAGVYTCEVWNPDFRYLTLYSNPVTISINTTSLPGAPGAITGPSELCLNPINSEISVSEIPDALSYQWNIDPAHGRITGNGRTVTVEWNDTYTGNIPITVCGINSVCAGPVSDPLNTMIYRPVSSQGTISGPTDLCKNPDNSTIYVTEIPDATSYQWNIDPAHGYISGNEISVTVEWDDTYTGIVPITVQGLNFCGSGPVSAPLITTIHNRLDKPGPITSDDPHIGIIYRNQENSHLSVSPVPNAETYTWSIEPAVAGTIIGNGNSSIEVDWNDNVWSWVNNRQVSFNVYASNSSYSECPSGPNSDPFNIKYCLNLISEVNALLDFYDKTGGPNWYSENTNPEDNWSRDIWVEDWFGITGFYFMYPTNSGTIEGIRLVNNNLSNSIPESISELKFLNRLFLNTNNLSGPIPISIGDCGELGYIDLDDNDLTGTLEFINHLSVPSKLVELHLRNNNISDIIPTSISALTSLRILDLMDNNLTGPIPNGLGNQYWIYLFLANNQLTGSIPESFHGCCNDNGRGWESWLHFSNNNLNEIKSGMYFNTSHQTIVTLDNNNFTFEDFINIDQNYFTSMIGNSDFAVLGQKLVGKAENITLCMGESYTIDLDIDDNLPTNEYHWYKGITEIFSGSSNTFTITASSASDAGDYSCVIHNHTDFSYCTADRCTLKSNIVKIRINSPSAPSGSISGNTEVCINSVSNYNVPLITNATSYEWALSDPNAGNLTWVNNIATIDWNEQYTGNIVSLTVQGFNGDCPGSVSSPFNISLYHPAGTPGTISGPNEVLTISENTSYSIPVIENAQAYIWELNDPEAGSISWTNQNAVIDWNNSYQGGEVSLLVYGSNAICGNGPVSNDLLISVGIVPSIEYNALVDLFNNTNGAGWTSEQINPADNWLIGDNVDNWFGVTVMSGHVSEIDLTSNNLTGIIPNSIGNLINPDVPVSINFAHNQFTGTIPYGLGISWQSLDLSFNQFDGIPDYFACNPSSTDILNIQNNRFTFEDLLKIDPEYFHFDESDIIYSPQANIGQVETKNLFIGESYTINLGIDASLTSNNYRWLKGGIEVAVTNTNNYTVTMNSANDAGVYTCEVTNPGFPLLTLNSNQVTITTSGVRSQEYDALVDLYNSTSGANWTSEQTNPADNWLTGVNVDNWFGVTILDGHVSEIDLSSNNLSGTLPNSIGNLTNLLSLKLNNNLITGSIPAVIGNLTLLNTLFLNDNLLENIPNNISACSALSYVHLNNNLFSFEDLLKINRTGLNEFYYTGQHPVVGSASTIATCIGHSVTIDLAVDEGVATNRYQWYNNEIAYGLPVVGNNEYIVTINTTADFGVYTCQITNDILPGLTLSSEEYALPSLVSFPGTITGPVNVCHNSISNYTVPVIENANYYEWFLSNPSVGNLTWIDNNATIEWNSQYAGSTVTLTVRGTDQGCDGPMSSPLNITIYALEEVGQAGPINGTSSLCLNPDNSIIYISEIVDAEYYQWNIDPAHGTITGTGTVVSVNWNDTYTGNIPITVRAVNSCSTGPDSEPFNVYINPLPGTISGITGNTDLCENGPDEIYIANGIITPSYNWEIDPQTDAGTVTNNGQSCIIDWNGSYSGPVRIRVRSVDICAGNFSPWLDITLKPLPGTPTTPTGPVSFCSDITSSIYTTLPVANATSYDWQLTAGVGSINGNSTVAVVNWIDWFVPIHLSVRAFNGSCPGEYSVPLDIYRHPSLRMPTDIDIALTNNHTASPLDFVGCPGESAEFEIIYYWPSPSTLHVFKDGVEIQTFEMTMEEMFYNLTLLEVGTYTIDLTENFSGCHLETPVEVSVSHFPPLTAGFESPGYTICEGSTANVRVNFTGTPPYSFTYTDGSNTPTLNNITTSYFIIPVSEPATLQIISVSDASTCVGVITGSTTTVTVIPLPDATFTMANSSPFCRNDEVVALTPELGGGNFSLNSVLLGTYEFNPAQAVYGTNYITYSVTVNGCNNSTTQEVLVRGTPFNFDMEETYCQTNVIIDLYQYVTGSTAGNFYLNGSTSSITSFIPEILSAEIPQSIEYELIENLIDPVQTCTASQTEAFTIREKPIATIDPSSLTICAGESVSLSASHSYPTQSGGDPHSYSWSPDGQTTESIAEDNIMANKVYQVTVTDAFNCFGTSDELSVTVNPTPWITINSTTMVTCPDTEDGEVNFSVNEGNTPISFSLIPSGGDPDDQGPAETLPVNRVFDYLRLSQYTLTTTSVDGCSDSENFVIRNGGPNIRYFCAEPVVCEHNTETPVSLKFNFWVNRLKEAPTTNFNYIIRDTEGNQLATGSADFNTDETTSEISGLYMGKNYELVLMIDEYNSCNVPPASATINKARLQWNIAQGKNRFEQLVTGDPVDVTVSLNITSACIKPDYSKLQYMLVYIEDPLNPVEDPNGWLSPDVNNGSLTYTRTVAGKYLVKARYDLVEGCITPLFFTIVTLPQLEINVTAIRPKCFGESTGQAIVSVVNNIGSYNTIWTSNDDPATVLSHTNTLESIPAGNYKVEVTDSRGRTVNDVYTLTQPAPLDDPEINQVNPCEPFAFFDGGGTTLYTYQWFRYDRPSTLIPGFAKMLEKFPFLPDPEMKVMVYMEKSSLTDNIPPAGKITAGEYDVVISDANQCVTKTASRVQIVMPDIVRSYDLGFRWKSTSVETKDQKPREPDESTQEGMESQSTRQELNEETYKCINLAMEDYKGNIDDYCFNGDLVNDQLVMNYDVNAYYYTLYYYDRAGNLISTVPPEGVDQSYTGGRESAPVHSMETEYGYNNMGNLVSQKLPDHVIETGGSTTDISTRFVYNYLGQLRFSQDARQRNVNLTNDPNDVEKFSYTKYDELGRVIEAGECEMTGSFDGISVTGFDDLQQIAGLEKDHTYNDAGYSAGERYPNINQADYISQQTSTVYSVPEIGVAYQGKPQRYLLNRVSKTVSENEHGETIATYYSYDPHGNVEWIASDIPGAGRHTMAYDYDLVSGNVKKASLNHSRVDAFYHKYEYDEDNRIKAAYTSNNGIIWDRDAQYDYYAHGPLKNIGLGQNNIQDIDYAYTLHGWLKAINTPALNGMSPSDDNDFAPDKFGMVLNYYTDDFSRTTGDGYFTTSDGHYLAAQTGRDLFNGNISSWVTAGVKPDQTADDITGYTYLYDKLNRIKQGMFNTFNGSSYTTDSKWDLNNITYDLNGNIESLERNGNITGNEAMDRFGYNYYSGTNRLEYVNDNIADGVYTEDMDAQLAGNYEYDETGNLVNDAKEEISIRWNVYGKVSEVVPAENVTNQKPHIKYSYDAAGNRVKKEVNTTPEFVGGVLTGNIIDPESVTTTYYVRDASGNIMAVYERINRPVSSNFEAVYQQVEVPLYGSDRLGEYTPNAEIAVIPFIPGDFNGPEMQLLDNTASFDGVANWLAASENEDNSGATPFYTGLLNPASLKTGNMFGINDGAFQFPGHGLDRSLSMVEDESGRLLFYTATPEDYWGQAGIFLLLNRENTVMPNSDGIIANAASQSVAVKAPGNNQLYYLFTTNGTGQLYRHEIDMSLENGLGNVSVKNIAITEEYGPNDGKMTAVYDAVNNRTILFVSTFIPDPDPAIPGSARLIRWYFNNTGYSDESMIYESNSSYGINSLDIGNDGTTLLLTHFTGPKDGLSNARPGEALVYNLTADYDISSPALATIALDQPTEPGSNAIFGFDENTILVDIENMTNQRIVEYNYMDNTNTILLEGLSGNIIRGRNGICYISPVKSDVIYSIDGNKQTVAVISVSEELNGRLGQMAYRQVEAVDLTAQQYSQPSGLKKYELKDHLGNIRVLLSDQLTNGGDARVLVYNNYYPFGSLMPGRSFSSDQYRFGFQGQEMDNEIKGTGNSINYKYRMQDPRIGRFFAMDPLIAKYPFYSPYSFSGNRVIDMVELEGLEPTVQPDFQGTKEGESPSTNMITSTSEGEKIINPHKRSGVWYWHSGSTISDDEGNTKENKAGWYLYSQYYNITRELLKSGSLNNPVEFDQGWDNIAYFAHVENSRPYFNWINPYSGVHEQNPYYSTRIQFVFPEFILVDLFYTNVQALRSIAINRGIGLFDDATKLAGRLGNSNTRFQIDNIATTLESRGWTITGGGGRTAEEYLKPLGGGRKGGSFLDITAVHPNYAPLRINTVDVLRNGTTATKRELINATRIRTQIPQGEHLLLIPKQ